MISFIAMKPLSILCAAFFLFACELSPSGEDDAGISDGDSSILKGSAFDVSVTGAREIYRSMTFRPSSPDSYDLSYKGYSQSDSSYFRVPLVSNTFDLCFVSPGIYHLKFVRADGATEVFAVSIADRPDYDPTAYDAYIDARKVASDYVFHYYLGGALYASVQEATVNDRDVSSDGVQYTLTTKPLTVMMKFLYFAEGTNKPDYFKYDYEGAGFVNESAALASSLNRIASLDDTKRIGDFTRPFSLPRTVTLEGLRSIRVIGSTLDRTAYKKYVNQSDPSDVTEKDDAVTHQVWPYYDLGFLVITDAAQASLKIPMYAKTKNIYIE